jgi:hypothetical protein
MCGGGVGSANDPSNDDETGSGNSFKETLANIFTPFDGMSYKDGRLTDAGKNTYASAEPYQNRRGETVTPKMFTIYGQDGNPMQIRSDTNNFFKAARNPAQGRMKSALLGAATGGIGGILASLATNEATGGRGILGAMRGDDARDKGGFSLKDIFAPKDPNAPTRPRSRESGLQGLKELRDAQARESFESGPTVTIPEPTVTAPEPTVVTPTMSESAAVGSFEAVPNPDYDPNDPMSQRFLSNPTYAQLLAYRDRGVTGMAEGGELNVAPPAGGNEKTMISDAVSAVKGEMSEEQSAVVLGQFLANYGEEALRDLVDKVQSGEFDDTVARFANGEAGEVRGPGDGSGVDDKVPASLEGQQDVLLADGEFVLRKKTADALEKKYGGGFLDAVNKAETAAPKTMQQYMARN